MSTNLKRVSISMAVLLLSSAMLGQQVHLKGQLWGSITGGDDPADGYEQYSEFLGYIPTLSVTKQLQSGTLLDFEWAHKLSLSYDGNPENEVADFEDFHRLWLRYSSERLEVRLGLQKIAFGPGMVLRPLAWFDTLDPKDPTNQTDGVEALRVRYFMAGNSALWFWLIRRNSSASWTDLNTFSPGLRLDATTSYGELGLTFHQDGDWAAKNNQRRIAIDFRFDGFVGLWTEAYVMYLDNTKYSTSYMIGGDYTFPLGQGLLMMTEHSLTRYDRLDVGPVSSVLVSYPISMFDQAMLILVNDWENKRTYNYLRWSRAYDNLSFNLMLSLNPRRSAYEEAPLPVALAGFGSSINFMIVYNH